MLSLGAGLLSITYEQFVVSAESIQSTQIAVGNYTVDGLNIVPSILTSINDGNQWSYTMNHHQFTPPNANGRSAILQNVSCSDRNFCVAVGDYSTKKGKFPMLVVSRDRGLTWTYKVTDTTLLPPNGAPNPNAELTDVSCFDKNCVAIGQYYTREGMIYPMLLHSNDFGNNWTYKMYDTLLPPPHAAQNPNVHFRGVSCHKNICAAVGEYLAYQEECNCRAFFPMLVVSTDAGNTWEYKMYDTLLPPPNAAIDPHTKFRNVSCYDHVCAAVGEYTNGVGYFPILVVSMDKGKTWTYQVSDTLLPQPDAAENPSAGFGNVMCNKKLCVAAGSYNDNNGRFPMVLTSLDKGKTWSYKLSNKNPVPHSGTDPNTSINALDCSGGFCVIGGTYRNGNGGDGTGYFPFIAVSHDQGNTWEYKVFDTYQAPPNIGVDPNGIFRGINCVKNKCTAVGDYRHVLSFNTFPMIAVSSDYGNSWTYKVDDMQCLPPEFERDSFDGILAAVSAK